ncbi:TRAP transporter small permease [Salinarimonas sp. NSM]|uniref:TRAP transporter small permease n=1 Tax=Salinarimonas sp. NSM TaxID=3458003 RepID=UPI004035877A
MPIATALRRLSDLLARIDRVFLICLVAGMALLVSVNVGLRLGGVILAWADEIAVYMMIMTGFVGASLMLRARSDPSVNLLQEVVSPGMARALRVVVAIVAFAFGLFLTWTCWRWFDLPRLASVGFDVSAFEGATFNFIYTEVTPVLGLRKAAFFLIVPWFALTATVHAATNLMEELGLVEPLVGGEDAIVGEG